VRRLRIIADDLTGACDVGAEFAAAGHLVRISAGPAAGEDPRGAVRVVNTQSRALAPGGAYARVLRAVRGDPGSLVLKKIDTALRGHLGAELDAVLDGTGAAAAFILAAIPAAARVTRDGCQWFGGRPLAETEFAHDPEGPGPESSIAAVLARESARSTAVLGREVVGAGDLRERVGASIRRGAGFFVVDAETDADVARAVDAILRLPPPHCLAGSIALAQALAHRCAPASAAEQRTPAPATEALAALPLPALVVSGSLHSQARRQLAAVVARGLARELAVPRPDADLRAIESTVATACAQLAAGCSVALAAAPPSGRPVARGMRATERLLADLAARIVGAASPGTLVLIGGETSCSVLDRLGARDLASHGRLAPLIAVSEVLQGPAAGLMLVTKGGSGGEVDALAGLLEGRSMTRTA